MKIKQNILKIAIYSRSSIQKEALDQEKNALLNLISNHPDIDKIYLYAKDPYEAKNQYLINICVKTGLNHYNNLKAFMEYLNDMQYVYKNIEEYNPEKNVKY